MAVQQYSLVAGDWVNLESIINDLARTLGQELSTLSSPEFVGLTLSGLTASRLVATDSDSALESVSDLTTWIEGTDDQINIEDDGDGTITVSTPQDLDVGTDFQVGSLTTTGTIDASAGKVLVEDKAISAPSNESDGYVGVAKIGGDGRIYFEVEGTMYYISGTEATIPIATGMPMGLLLALTYTIP
jgi:hypothetical protein